MPALKFLPASIPAACWSAALLATALPARADEVLLKSGIPLQGRVLAADEREVVVLTPEGRRVNLSATKVLRVRLDRPAVLELADDLCAAGRFAAAAVAYRKAADDLGAGLLRERTRLRLVRCLSAAGDEAGATAAWLDLLADRPREPAAACLPLFGLEMRQPARVAALLEERSRDLPPSGRAAALRGALLFWSRLSRGDLPRAREAIEALARLDLPEARSLAAVCRGWIRLRSGDPAGAAREVERAWSALHSLARPHAEVLLARCYAALGRHLDAAALALHLAFTRDDMPHLAAEGLFLAAESLARLGRRNEALPLLRRLARRYPTSPHTTEARRRIRQATGSTSAPSGPARPSTRPARTPPPDAKGPR